MNRFAAIHNFVTQFDIIVLNKSLLWNTWQIRPLQGLKRNVEIFKNLENICKNPIQCKFSLFVALKLTTLENFTGKIQLIFSEKFSIKTHKKLQHF